MVGKRKKDIKALKTRIKEEFYSRPQPVVHAGFRYGRRVYTYKPRPTPEIVRVLEEAKVMKKRQRFWHRLLKVPYVTDLRVFLIGRKP